MAVYKKHWWQYIHFETYLEIPFVSVQTRLFKEAVERMSYDICRIRVKVWKWSWDFQLYKRPEEYYAGREVSKKSNRANAWLKRKLAQARATLKRVKEK